MLLRYERPVSVSARLSRRVGLFSLLFLVIVFAAHRFGLLDTPTAVALAVLSAGLAALAAVLALIGLVRLWQVGAEGGIAAGKALVFAAPALGLVGYGLYLFLTGPAVYDISTDAVDVPGWISPPVADQVWMVRPATPGPEARAATLAAWPTLSGRRYEGAIDRVFLAAKKVAEAEGIEIVAVDGVATDPERAPGSATPPAGAGPAESDAVAETQEVPAVGPLPVPRPSAETMAALERIGGAVRLQGTLKSFLLGARFDIVIRLREEEETTFVDFRIASRYGPHDLGFGATIADHYLRALDAELLGIAGG